MEAIIDSSFVLAVALAKDSSHTTCMPVYRQFTRIYLPQITLAEIGYLLTKAGGNHAAALFLRRLLETKYQSVPLI